MCAHKHQDLHSPSGEQPGSTQSKEDILLLICGPNKFSRVHIQGCSLQCYLWLEIGGGSHQPGDTGWMYIMKCYEAYEARDKVLNMKG